MDWSTWDIKSIIECDMVPMNLLKVKVILMVLNPFGLLLKEDL